MHLFISCFCFSFSVLFVCVFVLFCLSHVTFRPYVQWRHQHERGVREKFRGMKKCSRSNEKFAIFVIFIPNRQLWSNFITFVIIWGKTRGEGKNLLGEC